MHRKSVLTNLWKKSQSDEQMTFSGHIEMLNVFDMKTANSIWKIAVEGGRLKNSIIN
jgi:hypothetical protein